MRICPVSERQSLGRATSKLFSARGISVLLAEVPADGHVIRGGHLECLERESASERSTDVAVSLLPRLYKVGVISRIGKDRYSLVVLRCGTQQGDPADVDFLHGICERAAWARDGRRERVQVTGYDGDRCDGLRCEVLLIAGNVASEDS